MTSTSLKIVHAVESYYPSIGGMQEVVRQLSERMVKNGHQVTVVTRKLSERTEEIVNGVIIKEFNIQGSEARGLSGEIQEYREFLLRQEYDVITFFAAQQWATDLALPLLTKLKAKKVFVPTGFSMLYNPVYTKYYENIKKALHHFDMNVFLSDNYRDINFARDNGITKNILIPNGAAKDEFDAETGFNIRAKYNLPETEKIILHVGSYTGFKGHIEAIQLFAKAKLRNTTLLLLGNDLNKLKYDLLRRPRSWKIILILLLQGKKIIMDTVSRKETVQAYKESTWFLFPSNIECSPIVLFECLAAGLPFLTTDVGNAAEIISWTEGGLLLPTDKDEHGYSHVDIKAGSEMIRSCLTDQRKHAILAANGHKAWLEKFSWEIITERYLQLYHELLANKGPIEKR